MSVDAVAAPTLTEAESPVVGDLHVEHLPVVHAHLLAIR